MARAFRPLVPIMTTLPSTHRLLSAAAAVGPSIVVAPAIKPSAPFASTLGAKIPVVRAPPSLDSASGSERRRARRLLREIAAERKGNALVLAHSTTIHFYRFFPMTQAMMDEFRPIWMNLATSYGLLGTFRVSSEGVNCGFSGHPTHIDAVLAKFKELWPKHFGVSFTHDKDGFEFPLTRADGVKGVPFNRLLYKQKKSVLTFAHSVDVEVNKERFITPSELSDVFNASAATTSSDEKKLPAGVFVDPRDGKECVLVDTRNDYEYQVGTFKDAIVYDHVKEFKDFPTQTTLDLLAEHRNRRLVTFCTGGVRCEKVVPYLVDKGFDAVSIRGGILAYIDHHQPPKKGASSTATAAATTASPTVASSSSAGASSPPTPTATATAAVPSAASKAWEGHCFVFTKSNNF